jgi:hypothetical protein
VAQSVAETYMKAYNNHDLKAVSMLFVPGGVFLPPNGAPRCRVVRRPSALGLVVQEPNLGGQETITLKLRPPQAKTLLSLSLNSK